MTSFKPLPIRSRIRLFKRFARFVNLPRSGKASIPAAWATLLICRAQLIFRDVAAMRKWASKPGDGSAPAARLAWSVQKACLIFPRASCLERALTLQRLLASHGHASKLHIGVCKNDGQFKAHAWLTQGDSVLIGGEELASGYQELTAWSSSAREPRNLDLARS
jgi:hypothetical protein